MVRRQAHVIVFEAARRDAADDFRALHRHAAKQLRLELHGRHGDVADVRPLDRNDGIHAVHLDELIVYLVDRCRVLLGEREQPAHIALLPVRLDLPIRACHHHQVQDVSGPVFRILRVGAEDDIAPVLLRLIDDLVNLRARHLDRDLVMLLAGPLAEPRNRELVKQQQVAGTAVSLGDVDALEEVIEISAQVAGSMVRVDALHTRLHDGCCGDVATQIDDRIGSIFTDHALILASLIHLANLPAAFLFSWLGRAP